MKNLVIGTGEIGSALADILHCDSVDIHHEQKGIYDILHICFPYSDTFVDSVSKYQAMYSPMYTVVHSTVPPYTCLKVNAIHSPVIGIHPFMKEGLLTFTKFLAGEGASEVADVFRRAGIKVYIVKDSTSTELMKILDTTFYALCIEYAKDVKRQCDTAGVPFELWTVWTDNYNQGYNKLGYPEFTRPNLTPIMKRQGGHCTINNCELLDTDFTNLIKKLNEHHTKD